MRRQARGLSTIAIYLAGMLSIVSCDASRLSLPGDVKDVDGRPVEGCKVLLLVKRPISDYWTGTISREATTDSAGRFSFNEFVAFRSRFRLRVEHPGYQSALLEGSWPGTPRRFHITLRQGPASEGVPQS
jgi:hypothetical protein